MYAQVTCLGLLAVYAYTLRNNPLYAVAGLATLYSQYLGVAMLFALNLHALIWWRTRTRREWLAWLAANVVVALGFLPWLPTFLAQQSHALNTSPRTPDGLTLDTLTAYGGGIAHGDVFLVAGGALAVAGARRLGPQPQTHRPTRIRVVGAAGLADAARAGARTRPEVGTVRAALPGPEPARTRAPGRVCDRAPAQTSDRRDGGRAGRGGAGRPGPAAAVLRSHAGARRLPRPGGGDRARGAADRRRPALSAEPGRNLRLLLPRAAGDDRAARPAADRSAGHAAAARRDARPVRPGLAGFVGDGRGRPARRDLHLARRERLSGNPPVVRVGATGARWFRAGERDHRTHQHAARQRDRPGGLSARLAIAATRARRWR